MDDVVASLRDGGLGIFPTETLWSLSCRADDPEAAQAIFRAKRRPEGVPLAVGFPSWGMARQFIIETPLARRLAKDHLPGPLSIVVERRDDRFAHVAPGMTSLSIRVPDHPVALQVLEHVGPCVMTSANLHGHPDPVTRDDVGRIFPTIPCVGDRVPGTASTVVDARGDVPIVLRQGAVDLDD